MILEYELKAEHIHGCTMKTLMNHITLEAKGYRCTPEMIFDVILKASVSLIMIGMSSLNHASLSGVPQFMGNHHGTECCYK